MSRWQLDDLSPRYRKQALRQLDKLPGAAAAAKQMEEKDFTTLVKGIARSHGWLAYHTYNSRRSDQGFPDIIAVKPWNPEWAHKIATGEGYPSQTQVPFETRLRGALDGAKSGKVVVAELKSETNYPTASQREWLSFLAIVSPDIRCYVWRPSDLAEVYEVFGA